MGRSTTPQRGSKESRAICLRYVLRHPVAFRDYFVPQVSKRRYWHRYAFTPVLMAIDRGDTVFKAGRAAGKSFAVLEPEAVRHAMAHPGEETMITALRHPHVHDRFERVIDYFELVPFLKLFLKRVLRSPYYIQLANGHQIYGISVGDDPEAKMAQGKHVSKLILEEAHQYPMRAWMKIQGSKDPRGSTTLMFGVPDGRMDTPFRKADTAYEAFKGRRFQISRRLDPYWSRRTKKQMADVYGGEDADMFKQDVDAEWGHPVWSAWDLEAIARCIEDSLPLVVIEISGKAYRQQGLAPSHVCADLPGPGRVAARRLLAADVGYTQPTEIGIFEELQDRWRLVARVRLVNRMEHDDQADILMYLAALYDVDRIGLDATEGEGRAIAAECEKRERWRDRVTRVLFNETLLTGWTPEHEEIWEPAKSVGTQVLRTSFAHKLFALPRDENIMADFNAERESRGTDGITRIITPSDVHITDMMRVLGILLFLDNPPAPPEGESREFVMPEFGGGGLWARPVV